MSETMETIKDIISDIRAQNQGLPEDGYALSPLVSDLLRLADRIEAAIKALEADRDNWRRQALVEDSRANATAEKSSVVGNAEKMREALETISKCDISKEEDCYTLYRVCEAALAAPPRNCDLYKSEPEAYQAYLTAMKNRTKKTYMYFEPWLFEKVR